MTKKPSQDDYICIGETLDCVNIESLPDSQDYERKAERARMVWEAYLVAIADESLGSFAGALTWSEFAVDAFLKWRDEQ